jgi:hypothetical protein
MSTTLATVTVRSGRLHESPNGWLWELFQDLDSGRVLVSRSLPDGQRLPDWHTTTEGYESYRQNHPQHRLPSLANPDTVDTAAEDPAPGDDSSKAGETTHAGTGNRRWSVEGVEPDYCLPLGSPVPFDSMALLADPLEASKRVEGSGAPVYRKGDRCRGVIGSVGPGESSGAAPEEAVVTLLEGNPRVETEGKPTVEHGSLALINSPRTGPGGAIGRVHTELEQTLSELERYGGADADDNLRKDIANASRAVGAASDAAEQARSALLAHQAKRHQLPLLGRLLGHGPEAAAHAQEGARLQNALLSADAAVVFSQARLHRLSDQLAQRTGGGPQMSGPLPAEQRYWGRIAAHNQQMNERVDLYRQSPLGGLAHQAGMPTELAQAVGDIATAGGGPLKPSTSRGPQGVHYGASLRTQRYQYYEGARGSKWRDNQTGRFVKESDVPHEARVRSAIERGTEVPRR